MSDNTVNFRIKITDDNGFKKIEFDAGKLRDVIEQVKNQADKVNAKLLNSNQLVQVYEQATSAVQGLQSAMRELTDAYSVQAAAEARLGQVMRNTMEATDADIQSIKDLAAAQQELGIVGDEVQLSGAQELASYLGKRESLERLIPVMNDMIAQQYGYNATAESAIQIASMMGKVMDGQVKALSRYGYSFTEAQEEILKFGTEEERAATLAEVIGESVGGVNAALAATDYGKIVQANNRLGDMKERFGALAAPAMTAISRIADFSMALSGIGKGIATLKSLHTALNATTVATKLQATAAKMLGITETATATATNILKVAVIGLQAAITIGLTAAIYGIIKLISYLKDRTDAATQATKDFAEASEAARTQFDNETSELQNLIDTIQDETAARTDQVAAIEILKGKYPDLVAKYIDEAGHITNLIGLQKELNRLRAGEKFQADRDRLEDYKTKLEDFKKLQSASRQGNDIWWLNADTSVPAKELIKERPWWQNPEDYVSQQVDYWNAMVNNQQKVVEQNKGIEFKARLKESSKEELERELGELKSQVSWDGTPLFNSMIEAVQEELAAREKVNHQITWQQMNYTDLGKAVSEQKKKVESLIGLNDQEAEAEGATLQAMQKRYDELGKQLDKVSGKVKNVAENHKRATLELIPKLAPKSPAQLAAPEVDATIQSSVMGFQNLEQINRRLQDLQQQRLVVSKDEIPVIDAQITYMERLRDEFEGISKAKMPDIGQAWSSIKGFGSSIRSIRDAITETDNAWDALTQTVDGFISLFQSFTSIIEIIRNITAVTKALTEQKKQETAQTVEGNVEEAASELGKAGAKVAASNMAAAAKKNEATANAEAAATGAASSVASIPLVGAAMAVAAVASVIAALASLPKFASGAVVYGPTLGLMGEYAGASSNPEVIAPLSKLQGLIGGQQGRSEVKFRIEGRELVGILNKQTNIYQRNG